MRDESSGQLLRVLGPAFAVAVGVGTVIGGGILRTPATVLDAVPSVGIALALWAALGIQSMIEANAVAEVMTMSPRSGGYFVPARAAFGEVGGLLVGWSDWLNYVAAIAAGSLLGADFIALMVPALVPHKLALTAAIVVALGGYNALGVKAGEKAQIVGSVAKALFLVVMVAMIFLLVPQTAPEPRPTASGPVGLAALVIAYQTIFGAYSGWNNASYFAGEDVDPGRNIPRGMFLSIAISMALFLLVCTALYTTVPIDQLRQSDLPFADALRSALGPNAIPFVAGGATLLVLTCANANVMGAPRILHCLGEKRMLPRWVMWVNRGGSPAAALALTTTAALALALTGTFETVFLIMAALGMLPQLLAEVALFRLRRLQPDAPRPWRAIGYPWLPGLAVALDLALLIAFLAADWRSGVYMTIAVLVVIPIGMAMRRSRRSVDGTVGAATG